MSAGKLSSGALKPSVRSRIHLREEKNNDDVYFPSRRFTAVPPSQHKMALVLIVVVFCVVMAVNLLLGKYLSQLPVVARVAVVVVAQVLLTSCR